MTIKELILQAELSVRVSYGSRWIASQKGLFVVYEHRYGKKIPTIIYVGDNEELAVEHLIAE